MQRRIVLPFLTSILILGGFGLTEAFAQEPPTSTMPQTGFLAELQSQVDLLFDITADLQAQIDRLFDAITDEVTDRDAADERLLSVIDQEALDRDAADERLLAEIDGEEQARQLADRDLDAYIDQEALDRDAADERLLAEIDGINYTPYTAGSGLILDGTEFSVDQRPEFRFVTIDNPHQRAPFAIETGDYGYISRLHADTARLAYFVADDSITSASIDDETITTSDILDGTITGEDIEDGTITGKDIDGTQIQKRVTGSCPTGQMIKSISQDGSVVCESDDVGIISKTSIIRETAFGTIPQNDRVEPLPATSEDACFLTMVFIDPFGGSSPFGSGCKVGINPSTLIWELTASSYADADVICEAMCIDLSPDDPSG